MNSPPSSSAAPAEKSLSSEGFRSHSRISSWKPKESRPTHELEGLSSELRLQTFLRYEIERVQSEIESALAAIKIIIENYWFLGARGSGGSKY